MIKICFILAFFAASSLGGCMVPNRTPGEATNPPLWWRAELNNVQMIGSELVASEDGHYLIDLPLLEQPDSLYSFFLQAHVPLSLFTDTDAFYPAIKRFIMIVPDWAFYDRVAKDAQKNGIVLEPATTNTYYYIDRTGGQVSVDSVHCSGDGHPQLNYGKAETPRNTLRVYRTESYGSVCCPKDPNWALAPLDAAFISSYEKANNVRIRGTYKQLAGKEGEYNTYYTLTGMSVEQRLHFLLAKQAQWRLDKSVELPAGQLFTPQLLPQEGEGMRKMQLLDNTGH